MTLVKLDNGDYINADNVCEIYHLNSTKKSDKTTKITWWIVMALTSESHHHRHITIADRDRIVEAMKDAPLHITADTIFDACCIPAWAITKGHGEML